jgi:mRNA-degrading endonuclease HigB of HigAB toxin-antitoxin module
MIMQAILFLLRRNRQLANCYDIFRVVVVVQYRAKRVYVREVMTHREYDDWCKLYRKGKV